MLKPRSEEAFYLVWNRIAQGKTADIIQRTILAGDLVCGTVGCQLREGQWFIGYGLGSTYWGKGIASRALKAFLGEIDIRPLRATTAATNKASIHILEKHGFVLQSSQFEPETERFLACEVHRYLLK